MTRLLGFLLSIVVLAVPPGTAAAGQARSTSELAAYNRPDREKVLLEGAQKEGKVLWYTSLTGGPNQAVPKAFEAKYPGIKVEVYRASSEDLAARVLQEAEAKRYLADVIETTFPVLKVMRDLKLLAPYFSPQLARYPKEVQEAAGKDLVYWATDRESYIGLAYNTSVVSGAAAPKSFDDLLHPGLKGKIGFATSDTGNRMVGAMLAVKGQPYLARLKSQEITLHAVSGRAILDMVISGELGASPTVFLSHSRVSVSKGAPIQWVPLDVVPTNAGGVAFPANAPHPHAALLFADYLLSPEGQKLLEKFGLDSPVNKPAFKRWYPEQGKSVEQYEKENVRWEKLLRDLGKK
ncbi:MAG TPA: extracellular solute-binding protein [candidate division Zixibacteria bacterium]|nr:extracellular solute-binding protein [candidate division Zixibacteria bacterium]